jgi:hypothetical protein
MRYVGQAIVSSPFTMMDPWRRPTRPRIDFSVEVRPAPFLPSSVTTSPLPTVRSTPCSTWDSPLPRVQAGDARTYSGMSRPPCASITAGIGRTSA